MNKSDSSDVLVKYTLMLLVMQQMISICFTIETGGCASTAIRSTAYCARLSSGIVARTQGFSSSKVTCRTQAYRR